MTLMILIHLLANALLLIAGVALARRRGLSRPAAAACCALGALAGLLLGLAGLALWA